MKNTETTSSKALKSGVWYVIGNFVAKAAGFITTPIFTRIMTKGEIGDYSNFISWIEILSIIVTLNLSTSIMIARFDFKAKLDDYISSNLVLGSIVTTGFYIIVVIFKDFFLKLLGFNELELHIAFVYLLVYPAMQMFLINSRIQYKYIETVFVSLISTIASTVISLLCAIIFEENRLFGRLVGFYVPLIFMNIAIYIRILKKSWHINPKYWKYGLMVSIPLVWHTLAGNLLGSSDRIMIRYFCGTEETALYSIAYYCGMIVSVFWSAVNNAWSPWAYEKMDEKNYGDLKHAARPLIICIGGIVFLFLLFAPEILYFMGGRRYSKAINVVPPVMLAYIFQAVYSLYVNIEFYSKKQHFIAIGTSIAAIINIVLNYWLIPKFGYIAAAYTTLVGYIVLFLIHYFWVWRMGKHNWYDSKFNIIFLIGTVVSLPFWNILYRMRTLRIMLIFIIVSIILFAIFKFRKEIYLVVKYKNIEPIRDKIGQRRR